MQSSYLNSDMGLFLRFDTDDVTGRPVGCSGLEDDMWLSNQRRMVRKPHGCPLNDMLDISGLKMHEIVQLFANDEQANQQTRNSQGFDGSLSVIFNHAIFKYLLRF